MNMTCRKSQDLEFSKKSARLKSTRISSQIHLIITVETYQCLGSGPVGVPVHAADVVPVATVVLTCAVGGRCVRGRVVVGGGRRGILSVSAVG